MGDDTFFSINMNFHRAYKVCNLQRCCGASRVPVSRPGRGRLDPGSQEGEESLHHPAAATAGAGAAAGGEGEGEGEGGEGEGAPRAKGETPATHLPA